MGLCKCPKRKVTSLFCREHNVNVCEFCMNESHKQCVIKSFSDWLSDSDAESNCLLCSKPLKDGECVRLQCLDVYHATCLADYGFSHPAHTAPAGYRCPICKAAIIPEPHASSITALKLKEFLATVNWARPALGLAALPEYDRKTPVHIEHTPPPQTAIYQVPPPKNGQVNLNLGNGSVDFAAEAEHVLAPVSRNYPMPPPPSTNDAFLTARRKQDLDMQPLLGNEDENKYERRTHVRQGSMLSCSGKRKWIYIGGALIVIVFLLILAHNNKDNDPLLNPQMDPNMAQVAPEA